MKEQSRQFVLFGDFRALDFNFAINLMNDFANLEPKLEATMDMPVNDGSPMNPPNMVVSRPIIKLKNNKTLIFIGTKRIHCEQIDDLGDYSSFIEFSHNVMKKVFEQPNIFVNRFAINGSLIEEDLSKAPLIYSKYFKNNTLMGNNNSEEWALSNNDVIFDPIFNSKFNRIFKVTRSTFLVGNLPKQLVLINYDFNTLLVPNQTYNVQALPIFADKAKEYFNLVMEDIKIE